MGLLDLAYRGVSKFPINPHIKNRSKAQGEVVSAALQLRQLAWAKTKIPDIRNWRRGVAYADLAYCILEKRPESDVAGLLALAREAGDGAKDEGSGQVWRRDRVLARVARAEAKLGTTTLLDAKAQANLDKSAWRYLADAEASKVDASGFDAALAKLDAVFAQGDLDTVRHAHEVCLGLYDRFYADAQKREALRQRLTKSYEKLPVDIRVDLILRMAASASSHDGKDEAHDLVKTALAVMESTRWLPEHDVPMRARIGGAYCTAGDSASGLAQIAKAEKGYLDGLEAIVNIYRAGCLRAIAEAYLAAGKRSEALEAYKRCVEAGMENPNNRPRAFDFSATCISLAVNDFEPDAGLRARLEDICRGLGKPW